MNRGGFPAGVSQPVQYGERARGFAVYLNQYQLIPYQRVTEMFEDLFGQPINQGILLNALETSYGNLESTENRIKSEILNSPCVHFSETRLYRGSERAWLHSTSTEKFTYYTRNEAMQAWMMLVSFRTTKEYMTTGNLTTHMRTVLTPFAMLIISGN
ncbi:MAG: hypothetical protein DDT28_00456 [Dehalococcoidia bacterium]|nr:hypothetical protein [Chloroflexota bacterium]